MRKSLPSSLVVALALLAVLVEPGARGAELSVWASGSGATRTVELAGEEVEARAGAEETPWEIVLYLEQEASRSLTLHQAADLLLELSGELTGLGTVEIVRADPDPRTALPPTRDAPVLDTALYEVLFRVQGRDRLRRQRRTAWEAAQGEAAASPGLLQEETRLLRERQDALLSWLADRGPASGPRLLLIASDALGTDPASYYLGQAPPESLLSAPPPPGLGEVGELAAAFGWAVAPLALPGSLEPKRVDFTRSVELPVGVRIRLGKDGEPGVQEEVPLSDEELGLAPRPLGPLGDLARESGGSLVDSLSALRELADGLDERRPWFVPVPGDRLGDVLALRFPSRDELRRVASGAPPALAALRIRQMLQDLAAEGELEVACLVRSDAEGEVADQLVQAALPEGGSERVRVTTGLQLADGSLRIHSVPVAGAEGDPWSWSGELRLPADTEAVVAVVQTLDGGLWGGAFARFVTELPGAEETQARGVAAPEVPRRLIRIEPLPPGVPDRRPEITVEAADDVAKVVLRLDGETAAELEERPFTARLKLENRRASHVVEALALDVEGREIDRDLLVLNAPEDAFWVRIVEPRSGDLIGPVDVEASVKVPAGERLDRVDFYWGERLIATARSEPYRRRILVPYAEPTGYIRVEAKLGDGSSAEDLILMNGSRFRAEVAVELVELFVVVTENGEPVRGLTRSDFRVLDQGVEQDLVSFEAAGDLPITVGLVIDSSLSLFRRFPEVRRAARSFVESLKEDRDRAFLVGFGEEPRVVQPITDHLADVTAGLGALAPAGLTKVWEGIVLSLLQLEGVEGRRALVVFYDGDEEDEKSSHRTAVALAERQGTPVYLVVMNNSAAASQGQSFRVRSFAGRLEELAKAGGGRVFYVRTDADLAEVFALISRELRSHYRLSYTPKSEESPSLWRSVEVEMRRKGLEARTVPGYEPGRSR